MRPMRCDGSSWSGPLRMSTSPRGSRADPDAVRRRNTPSSHLETRRPSLPAPAARQSNRSRRAAAERPYGQHRPDRRAVVQARHDLVDGFVIVERQCRVVELRFFAGLTIDETAAALQVSPDTVKRDWRMAKLWLLRRLEQAR